MKQFESWIKCSFRRNPFFWGMMWGFFCWFLHDTVHAKSVSSKLRETRVKTTETRSNAVSKSGLNHLEQYQIRR